MKLRLLKTSGNHQSLSNLDMPKLTYHGLEEFFKELSKEVKGDT